jgi:predicted DNA-binding transcriptional regulator YafY
MSRGRRINQILRTVDLFARPQGATIGELMEELGISRRSVYRQIETIEALGFPLYDDRPAGERQKRWRFDEGYLKKLPNISLPDMELHLSEMLALCMVIGESRLIKGTAMEKSLGRLMVKLEACFPEGTFNKLRKIQTLFVSSEKFSKDYSEKEGIIEDLLEAMLQQKLCVMRYHAYGEDQVNEFRVEPLHFFEHMGGLYAYVKVPKHGNIITLAVERIIDLTITEQKFDYPEGFDPADRFALAFGVTSEDPMVVRIRFSRDQARYVKERRWAAKQKIVEEDDGSIILEMRTSGLWDIARWVLSWGSDAEVLEPGELYNIVTKEIIRLNRTYF